MSDNWNDYAEGWDSNQDARLYSQKAFEELVKAIDIQGLRILDFGCGTGLMTEKMSPLAEKIVALDSSERMCEVLRDKELTNVDILQGYLTEHLIATEPLLHKPFDLIVASSVFAFVDDYIAIVKLLKSILCTNGLLIQWDWKKTAQEPGFGFGEDDLKICYQQAGLSIEEITEPYWLESEKGKMTVIMGIASNDGKIE